MRWSIAAWLLATSLISVRFAAAESVELTNGDLIHGKVVSLDEKELKLSSEIHGQLTIRRDKIAALYLGDRPARAAAAPPVAARPRLSDQDPALGPIDAPQPGRTPVPRPGDPNLDGVLRQLRIDGLGKDDVKQLEGLLPELGRPEVRDYFNKTVSGLMKGDISIPELRKQAIQARDQVKSLEKDLGPEATQALSGYLRILDKFIDESDDKKNGAKTNPAPDPVPAPGAASPRGGT